MKSTHILFCLHIHHTHPLPAKSTHHKSSFHQCHICITCSALLWEWDGSLLIANLLDLQVIIIFFIHIIDIAAVFIDLESLLTF